jgi:hypothetical protein
VESLQTTGISSIQDESGYLSLFGNDSWAKLRPAPIVSKNDKNNMNIFFCI